MLQGTRGLKAIKRPIDSNWSLISPLFVICDLQILMVRILYFRSEVKVLVRQMLKV